MLLLAELTRLWRAVKVGDAKTWDGQEALQDAVDDICEVFPTLKVEEVLYVFKGIRQGVQKIFGRLDTPTLMEALRAHESAHTVVYREHQNTQPPPVETAALEHPTEGTIPMGMALMQIANDLKLPRRTKSLQEMGGHLHLTADEVLTYGTTHQTTEQPHSTAQISGQDPQRLHKTAGS